MRTPKVETSQERCKGLGTGNYDPAKDDFLHGRLAARLWGGDFRDVKTIECCEACVFGSRYPHAPWCSESKQPYFPENVISHPEALL